MVNINGNEIYIGYKRDHVTAKKVNSWYRRDAGTVVASWVLIVKF